jgi:hypothetical protein
VLLYWDARPGSIAAWTGFTVYGGFAILASVDLARRFFAAVKPGIQHGTERAI